MKDLFRPRKRTVLLACLAIGVAWFTWAGVSSAQSEKNDEDKSLAIEATELRRELSDEQKRHTDALSDLQKARKALTDAKGDTAAIDRLIDAEKSEHGRREKKLKKWLDSEEAQSDDESRTKAIIRKELRDLGRAIGSLNQSVRVAPISSPTARTGGFHFVDYQDDPDYQKDDDGKHDGESDGSAAAKQDATKQGDAKQNDAKQNDAKAAKSGDAIEALKSDRQFGEQPGDESDADRAARVQLKVEALRRQLSEIQKQLAELQAAQDRK